MSLVRSFAKKNSELKLVIGQKHNTSMPKNEVNTHRGKGTFSDDVGNYQIGTINATNAPSATYPNLYSEERILEAK